MPPIALAIITVRSQSKHSKATFHSALPSSPRRCSSPTRQSVSTISLVGAGAVAHLVEVAADLEPGRALLDDERGHALTGGGVGVGARDDGEDVADRAVGDEGLRAVEDPTRRRRGGRRADAGGVRAGVGLGDAERPDLLAAGQLRQVAVGFCSSVPCSSIGMAPIVRCAPRDSPRPASRPPYGQGLERDAGRDGIGAAGAAVLLGDRQAGEADLGAGVPDRRGRSGPRGRARPAPGATTSAPSFRIESYNACCSAVIEKSTAGAYGGRPAPLPPGSARGVQPIREVGQTSPEAEERGYQQQAGDDARHGKTVLGRPLCGVDPVSLCGGATGRWPPCR